MRFATALSVAVLLAACGGDDGGSSTAVIDDPVTPTSVSSADTSTSIPSLTTATTAHATNDPAVTLTTEPANDGSESIGVTDTVTIVITGPED